MNCKKCGSALAPTDVVCKNCGEPVSSMPTNQMNSQDGSSQLNTNMNFQNSGNQTQNFQGSTSGPNVNINSNQQFMGQDFSQNLNAQPNNMMNNQYNGQSFNQNNGTNESQTKKKKSPVFIIIVVVLVLVVCILGYFVVSKKLLKSDDSDVKSPSSSSNSESVTQVTNTNSYSYKNFEFPIPNSYVASEDADLGSLNLINNYDRIVAMMLIDSYVTIDDVKEVSDDLKSQIVSLGVTVNSVDNKSYYGVDWVIFDCSVEANGETMNMLEAFAGLGSYHVIEATIVNIGSKSNDDVINELSNMISNTTYKGTTNFSSSDEKGTPSVNSKFTFDKSIFE